MSQAVVEMLAVRWRCTPLEVGQRLKHLLFLRGLIPADGGDVITPVPWNASYARKVVLGVTDDDRIAVLDEHDRVLLWLDDETAHA